LFGYIESGYFNKDMAQIWHKSYNIKVPKDDGQWLREFIITFGWPIDAVLYDFAKIS